MGYIVSGQFLNQRWDKINIRYFLYSNSMLLSFQAAAANRRLKEALAKQKLIQAERANRLETYNSSTIGNRVRVRIETKVRDL